MKTALATLLISFLCAAQIVVIQPTDTVANSRTTINNNFAYLQNSGPVSVTAYGALGNGEDDTTAFVSALSMVCSLPSTSGFGSKAINIPPAASSSGYIISSTISIPCSNLTLQGSGRLAPISYTGTGSAFDTNNKNYITFDNLFLYGTGVTANQIGISISGSSSGVINIRDSYILSFGTAPTDFSISNCTSANPVVCSTTGATGTGTINIVGFTGTGWALFNGLLGVTQVSPTSFSVPLDGTGLAAFSSSGAFWNQPSNITGCGISGAGDHNEVAIENNTFQVSGTGICLNGTFDLLSVRYNTFGVSTGQDSGFAVTSTNSVGSGRNKYEHNNMVTPGGAMNLGPSNGIMDVWWNQYESLTTNPPLSNQYKSAFYLNSASSYDFSNNNANLHVKGNGQYCFQTINYNYGVNEGNACIGAITANWNLSGSGLGQEFNYNSDILGDLTQPYSNPNYLGISHVGPATGYRGLGTPYPQSAWHLNAPAIPVGFTTALGAAITSTTQTTITIIGWMASTAYSLTGGPNFTQIIDSNGNIEQVTTGGTSGGSAPVWNTSIAGTTTDNSITWTNEGHAPVQQGTILYIGAEQLAIGAAPAWPTLTVIRAVNSTTAATAVNGSIVNLGPAGEWLLSANASQVSGATVASGLGYNTAFNGPYAWFKAVAPVSPPTFTQIPLVFPGPMLFLNGRLQVQNLLNNTQVVGGGTYACVDPTGTFYRSSGGVCP